MKGDSTIPQEQVSQELEPNAQKQTETEEVTTLEQTTNNEVKTTVNKHCKRNEK